jgi:hypothetical protein
VRLLVVAVPCMRHPLTALHEWRAGGSDNRRHEIVPNIKKIFPGLAEKLIGVPPYPTS